MKKEFRQWFLGISLIVMLGALGSSWVQAQTIWSDFTGDFGAQQVTWGD